MPDFKLLKTNQIQNGPDPQCPQSIHRLSGSFRLQAPQEMFFPIRQYVFPITAHDASGAA
jgi:hypothetical protein